MAQLKVKKHQLLFTPTTRDLPFMPDRAPQSYQRFFAELKRRRVFRVMAVYGVVGFGVIQVADVIFPRVPLPQWAIGLVVWLVLLGFPIAVVLAWAFEQTPEGLKRTERADPEEIEAIVAQPVSQRWPAGLLALLGAALLLGGWWIGRETAPGTDALSDQQTSEMRLATVETEEGARPSLAVLPFADMSPEGDQEYFSDGMTEELVNTLAKVRQLKVVARTSAFAFKGENLDLRAVGDSLGTGYLVEGSVRKAGDQLRITAQLIDAEDGSHLWSESYDRRLENVFQIQREIAEAIARQLRVPLGLEEGEQLVSPTEDLEAYDLYLAGRARMRDRSVLEAIDLFEAAIARDSSWAPAWAGLAESRALVPFYSEEALVEDSTLWANSLAGAERAVERALDLDPVNASALVALGNIHRDRWEWDEAEAAYRRALSIDPENVEAHQQYAEFLAYVGRLNEAYVSAHRALALDRVPIRLHVAGYVALYNGLYDEAMELVSEGIRMDPDGDVASLLRATLRGVYVGMTEWGAYREAVLQRLDATKARELRQLWPADEAPDADVASWMAATGDERAAASIYMALDDHERALETLRLYVESFDHGSGTIRLFAPTFDPLRGEPRFQALLASVNLEGRRPRRIMSDGD